MKHRTAEELIAFENRVKEHWEAGDIPYLTHLSGGNERELIQLFDSEVRYGDMIFSTHRAHYHYLLAGGNPDDLLRKVRAGKSMFLYSRALNFMASAIVAGTACIAAGVALAFKEQGKANRVWCFVGDGAEDQGHFYEAVMMVYGHDLPCTFIIEDNDCQVETTVSERRGPDDQNWSKWPACVLRYRYKLTWPHAGSGCQHHITFKV